MRSFGSLFSLALAATLLTSVVMAQTGEDLDYPEGFEDSFFQEGSGNGSDFPGSSPDFGTLEDASSQRARSRHGSFSQDRRFRGFLFGGDSGAGYQVATVALAHGQGFLSLDGQRYRLANLRYDQIYYATVNGASSSAQASSFTSPAATSVAGTGFAPGGNMVAAVTADIMPIMIPWARAYSGSDGAASQAADGQARDAQGRILWQPIGSLRGYLVRKGGQPPMWRPMPFVGRPSGPSGGQVFGTGQASSFFPRPHRPPTMVLAATVDLGDGAQGLYALETRQKPPFRPGRQATGATEGAEFGE